MESLESKCSENGRICENMMAVLDASSVRDEQHLERIRQMEATVMNEDLCSIDVFSRFQFCVAEQVGPAA